ncbi:MAG: hypothetical protein IIX13_09245 [Bacteroidales bacterium]|nr:hypothetical protein [Bacteroidales bacterium]
MEERKKIKWAKRRTECPACGAKHAFAQMVGEAENCGHCFACGVTFFPKTDKPIERHYYEEQSPAIPYEVPAAEFEQLVTGGGFSDTLRTALVSRIPAAMKSLRDYRVVSFGLETGFPLIDRGGKVHSIKIMGYGSDLHRIKTAPDGRPLPAIRWYHTGKLQERETFVTCAFGEHLIDTVQFDCIGVVESEKTAVIARALLPSIIFIAVGSKSNLRTLNYKGLDDKYLLFFPDKDGIGAWSEFVTEQNNARWLVSEVCEKLNEKEDIADAMLDGRQAEIVAAIGAEVRTRVKAGSASQSEARKIDYYELVTRQFSIDELRAQMDADGVTGEFKFSYDNRKSPQIETKSNGKESLYILYKKAAKMANFEAILAARHIPKYEDAVGFSFNFTDEEFRAFVMGENPCFFDGLKYDVVGRRYCREADAVFALDSHLRQTLQNLYASTLNEQGRKVKKEQLAFLEEFCQDYENRRLPEITVPLVQPQKYTEIITRGNALLDQRGGCSAEYWAELFAGLWTITPQDVKSMILFCAASIRYKFFDDQTCGKLIQITGDSNVGKDSFIPSLFLGEWIEFSEYYHQGALFQKGFLTIPSEKCKSLLYNIISDDLMASNEIAELSKITNFEIVCNNKYGKMVKVRNSWNKIVSNNNVRIILDKTKDKVAIARRYCIVSVRYLEGCGVADYINFFQANTANFFDIYAAFFAYCYRLAKDGNLRALQNEITTANIERVNDLYYFNNDDEIIVENFRAWCEDKTYNTDGNGYDPNNVHFVTEIKGEQVVVFRCDFRQFSPKLQKSEKYIKNSVLANAFPTMKFGVVLRVFGQVGRWNTMKLADYEKVLQEKETENQPINKKQFKILELWKEKQS